MIDFVSKRYVYYTISLLIILPGIISIFLPGGLNTGIEFGSGSNFTVRFEQPVSSEQLRQALVEQGHPESRIQTTTDGRFLVRTDLIEGASQAPAFGPAPPSEREDLETALIDQFGPMLDREGQVINRFLEFSSVSPSVSTDITRHAAIAVVAASIAIMLYLTFTFASVPNPIRYGVATLIALVHDVLIVIGTFSILGRIFNFEIDTLFITAMLMIIGFSVHDSIVVFDRMRENLRRAEDAGVYVSMADSVNASLNQTLARSLTTGITLLLAVLALILLGGETMRSFLIVILVGMFWATYSSMFIASQLLVSWDEGDLPGFRSRREQEESEAAQA